MSYDRENENKATDETLTNSKIKIFNIILVVLVGASIIIFSVDLSFLEMLGALVGGCGFVLMIVLSIEYAIMKAIINKKDKKKK
jgi:uncharacterized Tic20 family protein